MTLCMCSNRLSVSAPRPECIHMTYMSLTWTLPRARSRGEPTPERAPAPYSSGAVLPTVDGRCRESFGRQPSSASKEWSPRPIRPPEASCTIPAHSCSWRRSMSTGSTRASRSRSTSSTTSHTEPRPSSQLASIRSRPDASGWKRARSRSDSNAGTAPASPPASPPAAASPSPTATPDAPAARAAERTAARPRWPGSIGAAATRRASRPRVAAVGLPSRLAAVSASPHSRSAAGPSSNVAFGLRSATASARSGTCSSASTAQPMSAAPSGSDRSRSRSARAIAATSEASW
mmetsp:Transcript_14400/g.41358  ORF Transcript_14400/g.41358 Transcript_14400/m.41358 type:complete len:290 (-) Transcript_14400:551-1420(-)